MNQGSSLLTTVAVGPTMDAMLTTAIAFGDVNGDGSLDLFAGNGYRGGSYGEANELWLNDGTGVFTATSGAGPTGPRTGTTAAAFGDANGDGHLDLFVGNNLGPTGMDELWVNDGRGQFTNMPFGYPSLTRWRTFSPVVPEYATMRIDLFLNLCSIGKIDTIGLGSVTWYTLAARGC